MTRRILLIFFFLVSLKATLLSSDTIVIKSTHSIDSFYTLQKDYLEIFKDASGNMDFVSIKNATFAPITNEQINENKQYRFEPDWNGTYWFKFHLDNRNAINKHWLIEFLDFNIRTVKIYIPDEHGNYREENAGISLPFIQREIIHKNFEFDIPYSQHIQTIYIRVEPGNSSNFAVQIKTYQAFIEYSTAEYYLLGLFYGIILVMGIYNIILYINIGEKHYLFYVFYVVCVGLSSMCHDGTGYQFLWPGYPAWNAQILLLSFFGLVLWTLFYSKWFLNTHANAPRTNTAIRYLIWITVVLMLIAEIFKPDNMEYLIGAAVIPFILIYITAIRIFLNGYKPARFFLMAFTFFLLGYIIRSLAYYNVLRGTIFTVYSYNIGVLVEMILFSIAIGDKIKNLKQDGELALIEKEKAQAQIIRQLQENEKLKDKVNRELEEKVTQRTLEIKQKNEELEVANEQLKLLTDQVNQWNIRLDLDNRKLQTNIKEIAQARILLKDVRFDEFSTVFPDEKSCLKYLSDLKWKNGYQCKKCSNTNFGKGKSLFARRCTKCNYDESPTNDTLFHRLRFPITKAFYMVYLISVKDKDITADELSEILSLRRETCWSFKKRILEARKNVKKTTLSDEKDGWSALALISIN